VIFPIHQSDSIIIINNKFLIGKPTHIHTHTHSNAEREGQIVQIVSLTNEHNRNLERVSWISFHQSIHQIGSHT